MLVAKDLTTDAHVVLVFMDCHSIMFLHTALKGFKECVYLHVYD